MLAVELGREQGEAYEAWMTMRYAMSYMYIVCRWMYVYETVAVEFGGCYVGVEWSCWVRVHTMYNIYRYCKVTECKGLYVRS